MARRRRTSAVLETARIRLAGLKKIDSSKLGPDLSQEMFGGKVNSFTARLDSHNQLYAMMDDSTTVTDTEEDELQEWNRRILSGVEAQFGPDSSELKMIGGIRRSDRKRPARKRAGGSEPPNS
jgi:hypothetical protein